MVKIHDKGNRTSVYKYFFCSLALTTAVKIAFSFVAPIFITVLSNGWLDGEINQLFKYFLVTAILETIYLIIPVSLISAVLLSLFGKSFSSEVKFAGLYSLSCLVSYMLFTTVFPEFLDFWFVEKHAPYLGYFYYSLFNGFAFFCIVASMFRVDFGTFYHEDAS